MSKLLILGCLCLAGGIFAGPIDDIRPGEWYEVPNSHLYDVRPAGFNANVIAPWCGGAFDTKRNQLIVWGGGHQDYAGNEVYAFNLDSLKWFRLTDPSTPYDGSLGCGFQVNSDSQPISRHTYNGLDYLENVDKVFEQGGFNWPCAYGDSVTWLFDYELNKWVRGGHGDNMWGGPTIVAYDPVDGYLWCRNSNYTQAYNPKTHLWMGRNDWDDPPVFKIAAVEPERRLFVGLGNGYIAACTLAYAEKDTVHPYTVDSTSGDPTMKTAGEPGFVWDPVRKVFTGWNGGADVFTLDLNTLVWKRIPPAAANKVVPTAACPNGTYGRFRYSPKNDVYVVVNSITENVFIYRMSDEVTAKEKFPARKTFNLTVSPNPFTSRLNLALSGIRGKGMTLKVFDLSGRLVADLSGSLGTGQTVWNAEGCTAGVYLATAQKGAEKLTKRIVYSK